MPSVIHQREAPNHPDAVYIGRPTKWGNPFKIGPDGTRSQAIAKYEAYLLKNPALLAEAVKELRGKDLSCWCSPKPCHGDVLLRLTNPSGKVALF